MACMGFVIGLIPYRNGFVLSDGRDEPLHVLTLGIELLPVGFKKVLMQQ